METYEIREQEGFCWCLSPTCNSGQIHKPGNESPKMTCCKCGFETCFTHQRPWHQGRTCEEVGDLDSKAEKESEAWIKSQTKSCPTCDAATTKSEGCNMVICKLCYSGQWVWKSCIVWLTIHIGSCGEAWDWITKNLIDMDWEPLKDLYNFMKNLIIWSQFWKEPTPLWEQQGQWVRIVDSQRSNSDISSNNTSSLWTRRSFNFNRSSDRRSGSVAAHDENHKSFGRYSFVEIYNYIRVMGSENAQQ